jgi:hypothetical protein
MNHVIMPTPACGACNLRDCRARTQEARILVNPAIIISVRGIGPVGLSEFSFAGCNSESASLSDSEVFIVKAARRRTGTDRDVTVIIMAEPTCANLSELRSRPGRQLEL